MSSPSENASWSGKDDSLIERNLEKIVIGFQREQAKCCTVIFFVLYVLYESHVVPMFLAYTHFPFGRARSPKPVH